MDRSSDISNTLPPRYDETMRRDASRVRDDLKDNHSMINLHADQIQALINNLTNAQPANTSTVVTQTQSTSLDQPSPVSQSTISRVWAWMVGESQPAVAATHIQRTPNQRTPNQKTSTNTTSTYRPQVRERPSEGTHIYTRISTDTIHRPRRPINTTSTYRSPSTGTTDIYTKRSTDTTYRQKPSTGTTNSRMPKSTVEKNLQDLKARLSDMKDQITLRLNNSIQLKVSVQLPGDSVNRLPICEGSKGDVIKVSSLLPATLQKSLGVSTILDLLKQEYPELTSDMGLYETTEIPKFVFSTSVPLNDESKGNFFPELEARGKIAYLAWDSSGSCIGKGFKEQSTETKCKVLPKKGETFSGLALSQANLEGIEKATGVSAHFLASKVTIIGILIADSIKKEDNRRFASRGGEESFVCMEKSRLCLSSTASKSRDHTSFGMLGVQGAKVSDDAKNLSDRQCEGQKTLFCLEIVPQFSSKKCPVDEDMLKMATEVVPEEHR